LVQPEGVAGRAGLLSARLATTQQTNTNHASLFCLMRQAGLALEHDLAFYVRETQTGVRAPRLHN
jgi:hypothetical protein